MARAIYLHELSDPDVIWLLSQYEDIHPDCYAIEQSCLPIVLLNFKEDTNPPEITQSEELGFLEPMLGTATDTDAQPGE